MGYKKLEAIIKEIQGKKTPTPPIQLKGTTKHLMDHGVIHAPGNPIIHPVRTFKTHPMSDGVPEKWEWELWEFKEAVKEFNLTDDDGEAVYSNVNGEEFGRVDLHNIEAVEGNPHTHVLWTPYDHE